MSYGRNFLIYLFMKKSAFPRQTIQCQKKMLDEAKCCRKYYFFLIYSPVFLRKFLLLVVHEIRPQQCLCNAASQPNTLGSVPHQCFILQQSLPLKTCSSLLGEITPQKSDFFLPLGHWEWLLGLVRCHVSTTATEIVGLLLWCVVFGFCGFFLKKSPHAVRATSSPPSSAEPSLQILIRF